MDFDDLNPPLAEEPKGELFFGCLAWLLLAAGVIALGAWLISALR